jgi:hypothetical protein
MRGAKIEHEHFIHYDTWIKDPPNIKIIKYKERNKRPS